MKKKHYPLTFGLLCLAAVVILIPTSFYTSSFTSPVGMHCHALIVNTIFTLLGIVGTVLIVDRLNSARDRESDRRRLIRDASSSSNYLALRSLKELQEDGAFEDDSMIGCDLTSADLTGAPLMNANMASSRLVAAIIRSADLSGIDLSNSVINDADLSGSNLENADIRDSQCQSVRLLNTDLSGANLSGANFSLSDFANANLSKANLVGTNLDGAKNLHLARLTQSVHCKKNATLLGIENFRLLGDGTYVYVREENGN